MSEARFPWLFRLTTAALAAAIGSVLALTVAPAVRRAFFPIYVEGPGYRVTGQKFLYDALLGWRNVPGLKTTTFGQPLTINSAGLRGPERGFAKPPGVERILVLGDSYVWGYGVGDGDLFTRTLEQTVAASGVGVEVLNAGVSGWGTDQEYLWLREEGLRYSPDLVVLGFFFNDPSETITSVTYGVAKPVFVDTELTLANVPVPPPWEKHVPIVSAADPFDLVFAIIARMDRLCADRGARLVLTKFGNLLAPDARRLLDIEREIETRLAKLPDVPYLDLDEAFAAQGLTAAQVVSVPDGHWNARGHRETAAALYRFLVDRRLLD